MKYQIEVSYTTGNSFGSREEIDVIDKIKWNNLDAAKKSLKAINEHYKLYMLFNKEWNADKKQLEKELNAAKNKDWFYKDKNVEYWQVQIGLTQDDGTIKFISPFWCGYFESLWGAEILNVKDNDLKINFR